MFFKHFACKKQLPGFYISGTWVENGLTQTMLKIGIRLYEIFGDQSQFYFSIICFSLLESGLKKLVWSKELFNGSQDIELNTLEKLSEGKTS